MTDLLELCREYNGKCGSRVIITNTPLYGVRRVFKLTTDGSSLYGFVDSREDSMGEHIANLTKSWIYDITSGKYIYGTVSVPPEKA